MTKKMQQNFIALALFTIGLVFVYFNYLIGPLEVKHKAATANLQKTESKLAEMKRRALELPKLQGEMEQLEREVASLEESLPRNKEIPDLLRTVTKKAQKLQLKISNFTPGPIAIQANYNEVPFQMTLQGSYHALAHFLAELGQESRILNARNINLTAAPKGKDGEATVNVTFTLVAYTFKG